MMKQNFAVLGAGNGGQVIAAYLKLKGKQVTLYDRFSQVLEPIRRRGGIQLEGVSDTGFAKLDLVTEEVPQAAEFALCISGDSMMPYIADGSVVYVDNPHNYPDPGSISEAREPFVNVSIISPQEFVGNIMPLCQDRRGQFVDMQYLDTHLVEIHYKMPLNEIIYDFFDTLKAHTKGYASLDY